MSRLELALFGSLLWFSLYILAHAVADEDMPAREFAFFVGPLAAVAALAIAFES